MDSTWMSLLRKEPLRGEADGSGLCTMAPKDTKRHSQNAPGRKVLVEKARGKTPPLTPTYATDARRKAFPFSHARR